ncbi:MAG: amino acid carrier protein [Bacillota bacterium]|nr:amino acid carrier protein [Bacillota bacterium]
MYEAFAKLTGFLWGVPLLAIVLIAGIYFSFMSKFFQLRYLGKILAHPFKKDKDIVDDKNKLTPFQAVSIAIGGCVGVSNISGVATAVATGGPGAVFWLWVAALLGMCIKMVEVSLAVYYRTTKPDGSFKGGPTYYIQKAIGEERKLGFWKPLSIMFGVGLFTTYFLTLQNYTISEAVGSTFNISYIIPSLVVVACAYAIIAGGLKKVGEIAGLLVPFMCIFYVGCALFIIALNITAIPNTFALIFKGAFTTQAATGGFAGATVATAMRFGFARSVYSNEAGWGTSPMVHATAGTNHPIKQGMLGAFEVFVDTMVVCSMTAIVVITTGFWNSGLTGANLTLTAFESVMGGGARIAIAVSIFLFGLTTITGWYTYFEAIIDHAISDDVKSKKTILYFVKMFYPIPAFILVVLTVYTGGTPAQLWTFADFATVIPTFINVFVLLIIGKKFFELLDDYKARYLGVGKVDPNFKLFYEDTLKAQSKNK